MRKKYHSGEISNIHPCFVNMAEERIQELKATGAFTGAVAAKLDEKFNAGWINSI